MKKNINTVLISNYFLTTRAEKDDRMPHIQKAAVQK